MLRTEQPWPGATTGELLARMIQDVDLAGNAYIWDAGEQLVRLRPDWVTIISELVGAPDGGEYRRVVGYWYEPPPTELDRPDPMALPVDEVAHWSPIPDPTANFRGMSWMTPVLRDIVADNAMTSYKIRYLENAASPNLLIKYDQELKPKDVDTIGSRIQARYGGIDNAFKTMILDKGADVTVIGNTFEQMNFSTVQAAGENRIVIASGVPGIVIGSKEGLMAATYSNYEQAMRRFADITMRPLWRSVCACLSKLAVAPAGSRLWFDTCPTSPRCGRARRSAPRRCHHRRGGRGADPGRVRSESITVAVGAGDLSLLTHGGLPPVTVQAEKDTPPPLEVPSPGTATGVHRPSSPPTRPSCPTLGGCIVPWQITRDHAGCGVGQVRGGERQRRRG